MNILDFIASPPFEGYLLVAKILFLGLSLLLLVIIIILAARTNFMPNLLWEDIFEVFTYRSVGARKILKQWTKTKQRLETGLESEYKLAVIEADSTLDEVLKKMGYLGDTIGERLEKINIAVLPNVEEVREVHKTRNNIVHDPDFRLNLDEAKKVITIYEKALTELGAL
jgi:hypothetical protein